MQIDLARYATISADLAEGDRSMKDVLEAHGLAQAEWDAASLHWATRMAEEARVSPELAIAFSEAFAKAQDAKKPLPPYDVVGYATLMNEVESLGLARALGKRQISKADYFRLIRHWAKAIASDVALSKAYADARA